MAKDISRTSSRTSSAPDDEPGDGEFTLLTPSRAFNAPPFTVSNAARGLVLLDRRPRPLTAAQKTQKANGDTVVHETVPRNLMWTVTHSATSTTIGNYYAKNKAVKFLRNGQICAAEWTLDAERLSRVLTYNQLAVMPELRQSLDGHARNAGTPVEA